MMYRYRLFTNYLKQMEWDLKLLNSHTKKFWNISLFISLQYYCRNPTIPKLFLSVVAPNYFFVNLNEIQSCLNSHKNPFGYFSIKFLHFLLTLFPEIWTATVSTCQTAFKGS